MKRNRRRIQVSRESHYGMRFDSEIFRLERRTLNVGSAPKLGEWGRQVRKQLRPPKQRFVTGTRREVIRRPAGGTIDRWPGLRNKSADAEKDWPSSQAATPLDQDSYFSNPILRTSGGKAKVR